MKLIAKNANVIDLIIGERKCDENVSYRPLKYLVAYSVNKDEHLLYNNLTKAIILLNAEEYDVWKNQDFSEFPELKAELVKKLFLVEKEFDEKKTADSIRNISQSIYPKNTVSSFVILPTTACNARCFYCYEAGTTVSVMDSITAEAVAEYITEVSGGKDVFLQWFGGEPLYNVKAIGQITERLRQNGISYKSTMTTNGYLFDQALIKSAVENWKLKSVQITLDGMAETYNKVKSFKNGDKNAFDRVINNINLLTEANISVKIRLNMDFHNSEELFALAEFLKNKLKNINKVCLYVSPLYENVGFEKTVHNEYEKKQLTDKCIELSEYFSKLGFNSRGFFWLGDIRAFACQADSPSSVMILPDGKLGFCEHYLENDSFGSVFEKTVNKPLWSDYRKPTEKCNGCPLYPTCLVMSKCPNGTVMCNDYNIYSYLKSIEFTVLNKYKSFKERESDSKAY